MGPLGNCSGASRPGGWIRWRWPGLVLAMVLMGRGDLVAQGQPTPPLPRTEYFGIFPQYFQGDYNGTLRNLRSYATGAFRDPDFFLDSVCYWTMAGECHFRVGNYQEAIANYQNAMDLYLKLQAWPTRIADPAATFPEDASAARRAASVTWGQSVRSPRYGSFENTIGILLGQSNAQNEQALRGGGTVDPARIRGVYIAEVMRCVATAIYRMQIIKGPACEVDPVTRRIATGLSGQGGQTLPAAFQGVTRGIALFSQNDRVNARTMLTGSLQIGGLDHPLTPIALLTLGHIAAGDQNWGEAGQLYLEASIAGAAFGQADIVEEAMHFAATLHGSQRSGTPLPALSQVAEWARRERYYSLQASVSVDAAMLAAESGDARACADILDQAASSLRRDDLSKTAIQTRGLYARAAGLYIKGDVGGGDKAFLDYMDHAARTSLWLFRIGMCDQAIQDNGITERDAEVLYERLLVEPVDIDWLARPVDTMAYLATPHHQSMIRWFQIALARKSEERAIEIAELIRRQRFFSALPMGGRLMSLRWLLEAPDEALSENGKKQKQELLVRYPQWKDLSGQAAALLKELEALPIATANNSPERTSQKKLLDSLAGIVNQQETLIRKLSMMREPAELAFPRPLKIPEIQQRLSPDQMMVMYLKAGDSYHVMSLSKDRYQIEGTILARDLERKIGELLKQIGVGEKSAVYEAGLLAGDEWQETARALSAMVFPGSAPDRFATARELIVVPDGLLWYLPFEILQKGSAGQTSNLIDSVQIRYAPIASLGVPDERVSRRFGKEAIVAKRNFNRDNPEQITAAVEEMQRLIPGIEPLEETMLLPSSIASSLVDQLVVWHDHRDKGSSREGILGLSPMQVDEGKPGSSLASWMELPWRGVDQFVWTGLSSEVEGSTRNKADGSDLFMISTALMGSGTRTVLLSRWRVGGQSTLDLSREFLQELPRLSASEAWQRSVRLFREAELDLSAESRVREEKLEKPLTGQAPFFWSGYLLIDGGDSSAGSTSDPDAEGPPAENAAPEEKQPDDGADKTGRKTVG